jgi:hypothetical protein
VLKSKHSNTHNLFLYPKKMTTIRRISHKSESFCFGDSRPFINLKNPQRCKGSLYSKIAIG